MINEKANDTVEIGPSNYRGLENDALWMEAKRLSCLEPSTGLKVIDVVREIARRNLHLERGYSSLFTYLVKELSYSEASAYRRVKALEVFKKCPEIESKVCEGQINLGQVSLLSFVSKAKLLAAATAIEKKSTDETKKLLIQKFDVPAEKVNRRT